MTNLLLTSMPSLLDNFHALPAELRKLVQIDLCVQSLRVWLNYYDAKGGLRYTETVCGTQQTVDRRLPEDAMRCVIECKDTLNVQARYGEPICAMQDDDLVFPDEIMFAYYSIYNLFRKHVLAEPIDDWLIANQALSAHGEGTDSAAILESAMERFGH
jgi:hypothetical protein